MTLPVHRLAAEYAVALTFDDGPDPVHTPLLLDVLQAASARATFFVTVSQAAAFPDLVARMVADGHTVGNHGWDHVSLPGSPEVWEDQVLRANDVLSSLVGDPVALFRPPYGNTSDEFLEWCELQGLRTVLWSLEGGDWEPLPAQVVHDRVASDLAGGDVVLLHDGRKPHLQTGEVTRLLLRTLRERGLDAVPL